MALWCWILPAPCSPADSVSSASSAIASSSQQASPTERALVLLQLSRTLVERLTTRTGEVQNLSAEVESWRRESETLSAELSTLRPLSAEVARLSQELQTALAAIGRLQSESVTKQNAYTQASSAERTQAQTVLDTVTRSRDIWQAIGLGAIVAAVLGWLVAALT